MPSVSILTGNSGRHYIGSAIHLETRFRDHCNGNTHTTKRLGGNLKLVAHREYQSLKEARNVEKMLKRWKNPSKAMDYLHP